MSGTSLDGIDAVLVDFAGPRPQLCGAFHAPFRASLRGRLLELNSPGADELDKAAQLGNELARCYAQATAAVLRICSVEPARVRAIGCHGQTVRHHPERGYTIQLGNGALLAELSGICVVADFRSRDVAAGGQGAPLVPAFHAMMFADPSEDRAVLNLGGIANLTCLPRVGPISGFDTGPGNCLLDLWATRHLGKPFDEGGTWAAGGCVTARLLKRFLADPYFAAPPPKSTGRERFNERWLLDKVDKDNEPAAVQATLLELSARSVREAAARHCGTARRLIVCGGGARNRALIDRLSELFAPVSVESSERHGPDPAHVEAMAFAWLAQRALALAPASVPTVTGARGPRVLGAIYPR